MQKWKIIAGLLLVFVLGALTGALGALLTLEDAIDFDAPDDQPVDLLFVLLVPEEANQQHLDILAGIARLFSQPDYCSALRAADSDRALFEAALTAAG